MFLYSTVSTLKPSKSKPGVPKEEGTSELTDCGDCCDNFTKFQLVQNGGLTSGIKTNLMSIYRCWGIVKLDHWTYHQYTWITTSVKISHVCLCRITHAFPSCRRDQKGAWRLRDPFERRDRIEVLVWVCTKLEAGVERKYEISESAWWQFCRWRVHRPHAPRHFLTLYQEGGTHLSLDRATWTAAQAWFKDWPPNNGQYYI